jgi:hypothetical protein
MDFIPGDQYRIDVVGADGKLLVDSWSSCIKTDIVSDNDTLMVDTANEKLYGPLVGNLEDISGNIIVDTENSIVTANLMGNLFNNDNELVLDSDSKAFYGDVFGNILDTNGECIVDTQNSSIRADYFEGRFYGEFHGTLITDDSLNSNPETNFIGNLYGNVIDPVTLETIIDTSLKKTKILGTNKQIQIGDNDHEIHAVGKLLSYKLLRDTQLDPAIIYRTFKGNNFLSTVSETFEPNEVFVAHTSYAYHENEFRDSGIYGFAMDNGTVNDYMPSKFFISVSDGVKMPSAITSTRLELDGKGILSVPVLQARGINLAQRDSLPTKAGMIVFNESSKKFQGFDGNKWIDLH